KFVSVPSYREQAGGQAMAQEPLATKGNFLDIYDFRVIKGKEEEFIRSFEKFDYSDGNPRHKSRAQVQGWHAVSRYPRSASLFLDCGMVGHRRARAHPKSSGQRDQA